MKKKDNSIVTFLKNCSVIRSMLSDTPERIAIRYNVDLSELIRINPELVPNHIIQIGSEIILPELQKETKKKGRKVNKCK